MTRTPPPLQGIRVLDFSWALGGPFGTQQLVDLGAEVIRVEPPTSTEEARGLGPYVDGLSTYFFSVNRGKRSVCIDLKTVEGKRLVRQLLGHCDVLVESFSPGTMDRLGLGYASLRETHPRLVYAALSGFGQTGPYRTLAGVDAVAQGMGGTMSMNGAAGGPPMRMGVSVADYVGGLYLAMGILAALRARDQSGAGQMVDIALCDAQIAFCENAIVRHSATGERPTRQGGRHRLIVPFGPFATADGHLVVSYVKDWGKLCRLIGRPELADDPRAATAEARVHNADFVEGELASALGQRTTDEWFALLAAADVGAIGRVQSVADLFADPGVAARGMIKDVPLPGGRSGSLRVAASPLHLSETPAGTDATMPLLGQHTDQVLTGVAGISADELIALRAQGIIR
jgi:CoA:oxalate CoA-transferase